MRSDLHKAALQKLAQLTENELLSPESRATIRDRLLKRCSEPKKLVNGVNDKTIDSRTMVCYVLIKPF